MADALAYEVFEELKKDIEKGDFGIYLDTWDYEDEYSHNDIEIARGKLIELAKEYFRVNTMDYEAKEVNENVYIFNKSTGERL